jgi:hypothetical protein
MTPQDVIRLQACYLLGAYPGIDPLLDDLARAGVRTACLSNTSDSHWQMMHDRRGPHYLPLDRLDYRFASHLVACANPTTRSTRTSSARPARAATRSCSSTTWRKTWTPRSAAAGAAAVSTPSPTSRSPGPRLPQAPGPCALTSTAVTG